MEYGEFESAKFVPSKKAKGFIMKPSVDAFDQLSEIWKKYPSNPDWVPTPEQLPFYVLSGRLKHIPPPLNKVVKIFLSSTFTDMYVERNYLFVHVYPALQKFCRDKHNLEFQVVDMRWGVREEASLDHSGPKTCMDELRSCQELSLGPNFVCLLGQRYGGRPLQAEIDKTEFDTILESLESLSEDKREGASVELLRDWYKCDANGIPPTMILTPLNEREPPPSDFDKKESGQLHLSLRIGAQKALADGKLSEELAQKYFWSVTEEEIYRGVLSQPDAQDHALCFERVLVDIDYEHSKVHRFVEMTDDGKINHETAELMQKLTKQTFEKLGPENSARFDNIKWSSKGGTNEESLAEYLKEFGELFRQRVEMLIDRAAAKRNPLQDHPHSNLLTEIAEHDYQAQAKIKTFQGRDDIMNKIKQYIMSQSNKPYVMYGESGYGKTSLLAVASIRAYDWLGDTENLVIVRRFLGTTPDSTNIGSLLDSVIKQISFACNFKPPHTEDRMQALLFTLISVPKKYRLVLFLDSLDQLSAYGKAHTLLWVPLALPPHVKLIVSTLPKDHGLLDILRGRRYHQNQFVEVNILETELSIKLMEDWLEASGRKLSDEQLLVVKERFAADANTSPLYIKLIYDVVLKKRSYFSVGSLKKLLATINSPIKCIRYIYTELMRKNGDLLVHRLFAYLHLSKLGLTENEMVDLISLDDEVLSDVFQFSAPPLRRLPAVLWARIRNSIQEYIVTREANGGKVIAWYHRQFVEVGDTIYKEEFPRNYNKPEEVKSPAELCDVLRDNMVNYFTGKWSGGVKKPFKYTPYLQKKLGLDSPESAEDRLVPAMPNVQDNGRPNLRKLGQLPTLLIKLGRIEEFFYEVFGNIEGLTGLFSMYSWSDIYELADGINFDNQKAIGKDKDDVIDNAVIKLPFQILVRSFLLTSALASAYPKMLGPLVLGRLLPFAPGSEILRNFMNNIYEKGPKLNSFVCPHVQLEGVGTYLIFEMPNDHVGSCVAMMEVTPGGNHYILTLSKKAVLINMSDGNIQMRYMPPDLGKDDSFHLVDADEPFDNPEEILATTKIVPKIYIFSLKQFDLKEVIDCRQVKGCEEMRIQDLRVFRTGDKNKPVAMVSGNASEGVLMYDVSTQALIYRFSNNRPILFVNLIDKYHMLFIQSKKVSVMSLDRFDEKNEDPKHQQHYQSAKENGGWIVKPVSETKLALPGDSIVTAKYSSSDIMAFSTEDGHLYIGVCTTVNSTVKINWARILLDSPAVNISATKTAVSVCTKHFTYIVTVEAETDNKNDIHSVPAQYRSIVLDVKAKLKISLSCLRIVTETICMGYHLGQLYVIKISQTDNEIGQLHVHRTFDAHSKPITGIIVNEDIAVMVLTSAADGSVRVWHCGLNVHPQLQEANSFDRMGEPIHRISATSLRTASISQESSSVAVWNTCKAKIVSRLDHSLADSETLSEVVCFNDRVVTVTCNGLVSFWDLSQVDEPFTQINVNQYQSMVRGCSPYEVLIKTPVSWHRFDSFKGTVISEKIYDDRTILKISYINGQLSMLQMKEDDEDLVIEILNIDQETCEVNITKEKLLPNTPLQNFFCCDHIIALLYTRECIFYNWKKSHVLSSKKINKPLLIASSTDTLIMKSNVNIQSYKIKQGVEKLSSRKLESKHDMVKITPDGNHVIVVEAKKMLLMYKINDLSAHIGQYSLYGEIEKLSFTDDSSYLVLGIADTRLFYLLLCDITLAGHHERALALKMGEFSEEEVKRGKLLVQVAGEEQDSSDDEGEGSVGESTPENINVLCPDVLTTHLNRAERLMIGQKLVQGHTPLQAIRSVKMRTIEQ